MTANNSTFNFLENVTSKVNNYRIKFKGKEEEKITYLSLKTKITKEFKFKGEGPTIGCGPI